MTKATQVPWTPIKTAPVPIAPSPPGVFRIVSTSWSDPLTGTPRAEINQPCELADLSDGRRVARQTLPGQHGKPVLLYWLVDPDPGKAPVALGSYKDETHDLIEALDRSRSHPKNGTGLLTKTPLEAEIAKFRAPWPEIANHLGFNEIKVERLFDVGELWRTMAHDNGVALNLDFRAYLDAHGAGSWGVNGRLEDVPPLTAEQTWTIGLCSQDLKNTEVIRSGLGVIRSEYRETGPSGRSFTIVAETALMPDPRRTFTWLRALASG
jgi:hypothetical protein